MVLGAGCITAAVLAGCSSSPSSDKESGKVFNFPIRETLKTTAQAFTAVDGADTTYLTNGVSIQWPEQLGAASLKPLQEKILRTAFDTTGVTIDRAIESMAADTTLLAGLGDIEAVDTVGAEGTNVWYNTVTGRVAELTDRYVSYTVSATGFTGGAHPFTAIFPFTYDFEQNKVLGFYDYFVKGSERAVYDAVVASVARQLAVEPSQLEQMGVNVQYDPAKVDVYVVDNDIVFHFNPYDIAPYSAGTIDAPVGVYSMGELLTPEATALLF